MNKEPFFSILIATYNRSEYLERCLNSIFANDFSDFEVVVSDDHSQNREEIEEVLQPYLNRENVRVVWQPKNLGIYPNYNFLLGQAQGRFVLFVDDDDKLKPTCLSKLKEYIKESPDYDLYGLGYEVIDEKDRVVRTHQAPKSFQITSKDEKLMKLLAFFDILPFWAFHSFAVCYKTSIREEITYRSDLSIAADSFFLFQCLSRGKKLLVLPENLYSYRIHEERWTGPAITNIISRKAVLDHFRGFFEPRDMSTYLSALFSSKEYMRRYLFDPIIFNRLAKDEVLRGELNLVEDDMKDFNAFFLPRIYLWHAARIRTQQVVDYLRLFGLKGLFVLLKTFLQQIKWKSKIRTNRQ